MTVEDCTSCQQKVGNSKHDDHAQWQITATEKLKFNTNSR